MAHGPAFWLPAIVQPIGTVAIGVAGFVIARRQWLISNEKFRYDLFQKRYEIYELVASHLRTMMQEGVDNTKFAPITGLERVVTEVTLFYGTSIANSVQNAATSARRLLTIRTGDIDYQMQQETMETEEKLINNIEFAGTTTLYRMMSYIDFSESGRPANRNSIWSFKRASKTIYWLYRWIRQRKAN